jgi:hypothetical protein
MTFTTGPSATDFHFAVYAYGAGWVRVDDIVLTYANGTVPQQTVLHPGVRNVGKWVSLSLSSPQQIV